MRIFIHPKDIEKKEGIKLNEDKSHYLISVVRLKKGDTIEIIDGKGKAYEAKISEISKGNVFVNIISEIPSDIESDLNFILCQSILKGEKMDIVIQKTTELGVKEIIPVITERCLVKKTRKIKRWQKIAEESVEQCGRTVIPTVHEPVQFGSLFTVYCSQQMDGFIFWEEGGLPLKDAIQRLLSSTTLHHPNTPIFIFIGPEGGLTFEEVQLAEKHGLIRTTLGKRILRAETAAIVSVAFVQFLLEERH
jgi:16S rRNA (uracil1498-N3)-methyltransferase